eukprot:978049-Amphidinium_carterae.1
MKGLNHRKDNLSAKQLKSNRSQTNRQHTLSFGSLQSLAPLSGAATCFASVPFEAKNPQNPGNPNSKNGNNQLNL